MQNALRIAIALDGTDIPAWMAHLLDRIQGDRLAEIQFLIWTARERMVASVGRSKLLNWHYSLDQKRFQDGPDAFRTQKIGEAYRIYSNYQLTEIVSDKKEVVKDAEALLWLSDQEPEEALYELFPMGVWSFVHGEEETTHSNLLGYWEFVKLREVIVSGLRIRRQANSPGHILFQSWSVVPSLSISRAIHPHFWKIQAFFSRALKLYKERGKERFLLELERSILPKNVTAPKLDRPTGLQVSRNLLMHSGRLFHKVWKKIRFHEQWLFLYKFAKGPSYDFASFQKIWPPKDRFWADPFLFEKDGRYYLFFEELPFQTDKGHLSVMELFEDGSHGPVSVILDKPYHLSYPFLFEYDNRLYMIPESYQADNIQLYECTDFPTGWTHRMNLMENVCAMDTTLFYHEKKWWMFTALTETEGSSHHDELFLFYADTPLTNQWTPHPQNPIVSDVRRARPAGNLYWQDGLLIRPSQDCARKYGFGFNLNIVEELTETTYREKRWKHVRPDWDKSVHRTHSIAHLPGLTVIDGLVQRRKY